MVPLGIRQASSRGLYARTSVCRASLQIEPARRRPNPHMPYLSVRGRSVCGRSEELGVERDSVPPSPRTDCNHTVARPSAVHTPWSQRRSRIAHVSPDRQTGQTPKSPSLKTRRRPDAMTPLVNRRSFAGAVGANASVMSALSKRPLD